MAKKKEFKPTLFKDLDKERKRKFTQINDKWTNHPFVEFFFGLWEEYIAWFEGDQYKYYNRALKDLTDVTALVDRDIKNVYNRIMPSIRAQWGELRYPHEFHVAPNTSESEDIKAAMMGSRSIESRHEERKFRSKINRGKLWSLICGICYWKVWWDSSLWGLSPKGSGDGNNKVPGDVNFDFVNPFNCRPDPISIDRDGWRYFLEGKRVPVSLVEAEFELEPGTVPGEVVKSSEIKETGLFERDDYDFGDEPTCVRMEWYERESFEGNKTGRFIVTTKDIMLYDGKNPNPEDVLGYFPIPGLVPRLNTPIYDSAVRIMQQPQRQFNRLCSQVDEHVENWKIKGMIPYGSLLPGEKESFTRNGVDFVTYNARMGTPYFQAPPALPEFLGYWVSFMENEMETESSVRKTSLGQIPPYAQRASGVLFDSIKRQDDIVLIPAIEELDVTLADSVKFELQLVQDNYTEERLVKSVGRHRVTSVVAFMGSDLRDNTDVRVRPGTDIITTKNKKEQVVMAMIDKGLINEPRKALEMMGYKDVEDFVEDEFMDERQARRQLEIMKEGKVVIHPNRDDNHQVMYDTFNNSRKSEEWDSLPEKAQKNIEARIQEERAWIPELENQPVPGEEPPEPETRPGETIPGEQGAIQLPEMAGRGGVGPGGAGGSPNPPVSVEEILAQLMPTGGM